MAADRFHAVLKSCTLVGIDAELVNVECTIDRGLPQYSVVGLAAPSVKEGATRIRSALKVVGSGDATLVPSSVRVRSAETWGHCQPLPSMEPPRDRSRRRIRI